MHLGLMFWSGLDWGLALVPVVHQHFPVTSKPPMPPEGCWWVIASLKDSLHTQARGPLGSFHMLMVHFTCGFYSPS